MIPILKKNEKMIIIFDTFFVCIKSYLRINTPLYMQKCTKNDYVSNKGQVAHTPPLDFIHKII